MVKKMRPESAFRILDLPTGNMDTSTRQTIDRIERRGPRADAAIQHDRPNRSHRQPIDAAWTCPGSPNSPRPRRCTRYAVNY